MNECKYWWSLPSRDRSTPPTDDLNHWWISADLSALWSAGCVFQDLRFGPQKCEIWHSSWRSTMISTSECWMPMTELQAGGYSLMYSEQNCFISARVMNSSPFYVCSCLHPWNPPPPLPIPLVNFRPWPRVTGSTSMYRVPWIGSPSMENATPPRDVNTGRVACIIM